MEQTECCLGGIRLSGVLRPKQVASVGAQTKSRAWPCGLAHRVPRASPMRAASGCLHLQFRIILHYVPDFQPRTMILLPGTRNILPTKTDDAGAAAQPKRRGRGAVRRANGLSADSTLDFRCRFARHRASPASFRPSGRPRAVGHETLRVTKGHENARPSVVSDNRRCQAAQAASGNANSSWSGSFSGGLRGRPAMLRMRSSPISERRFARSGCVRRLCSVQWRDPSQPFAIPSMPSRPSAISASLQSFRRAC